MEQAIELLRARQKELHKTLASIKNEIKQLDDAIALLQTKDSTQTSIPFSLKNTSAKMQPTQLVKQMFLDASEKRMTIDEIVAFLNQKIRAGEIHSDSQNLKGLVYNIVFRLKRDKHITSEVGDDKVMYYQLKK